MEFSIQGATDYIGSRIEDFYAKKQTLLDQREALYVLALNYQANGLDPSEVYEVVADVQSNISRWNRINDLISPVVSYFGYNVDTSQLGVLPLIPMAYGAAIITAAGIMYVFYNKVSQHSAAIRTLASKIPLNYDEQAIVDGATTSGAFESFGKIANTLLIGGAIYLAIILLRR